MRLRIGRHGVDLAGGVQVPKGSLGSEQGGGVRDGALLRGDVGRVGQLPLREVRAGHLSGQELSGMNREGGRPTLKLCRG